MVRQLEATSKQILLGSMIGKGSVHKTSSGALVYRERRPATYREYLEWKATTLGLGRTSVGGDDHAYLEIYNNPNLPALRRGFYGSRGRKSAFSLSFIDEIDLLGLLIIYLDIGGMLGPNHAGIKLTVFPRTCVEALVTSLNKRFGLSLYLSKEYKNCYSGTESRQIIIDKDNLTTLIPKWLDLLDKYKMPNFCYDKISTILVKQPQATEKTVTRQCIRCSAVKELAVGFPKVDKLGYGFSCNDCVGKTATRKVAKLELREQLTALSDKNNAQAADALGLTRQRVHHLRKKWHLPNPVVDYRELTTEERDLLSAQRARFRHKKYNCRRDKVLFSLKFNDITWPTRCPIFGTELDYFAEKKQENSPSFDRVNPKLGYVVGNVCIISHRANIIKNDGTSREHRLIAEYIDKHAQAIVS